MIWLSILWRWLVPCTRFFAFYLHFNEMRMFFISSKRWSLKTFVRRLLNFSFFNSIELDRKPWRPWIWTNIECLKKFRRIHKKKFFMRVNKHTQLFFAPSIQFVSLGNIEICWARKNPSSRQHCKHTYINHLLMLTHFSHSAISLVFFGNIC